MDPFVKPPTISDDYRMAEIYRQSSEVFHEKGFELTSMAEIAESVDLTQGGLYYYIKGKKALLFAIMSYALDRLDTEILHPARRLEDPAECLNLMVSGYVRLASEEPSVFAMLEKNEEDLEEAHAAKIQTRKRLLTGFLGDVISSLFFPKEDLVDPEGAATQVLEMIHSARSWNDDGRLSHEEATSRIVDRVLSGMPSVANSSSPN